MSELNKYDLEQELKVARRLLKTPEGLAAFKDTLLRSKEGRELVHSEFGIAIVDKQEENDKPVVAILIPTHKKWENETSTALEQMVPFSRQRAHVIVRPGICSSIVHWVRNQLLSSLYQSGIPFTHVLLCDDDMVPPPDALVRLLDRNVDVVGAVCTVRKDPPLPNARHFSPEGFQFSTADIDQPGIWTVGAIGTGFMLLTKKVLDAVGEYYLNCSYEQKYLGMSKEAAGVHSFGRQQKALEDHNRWWFECLKHPLGHGEYGEDISFCFKARECGFEIYADSTFQTGHVGTYPYGLGDYWAYRDQAVAEGKVVPLPQAGKTESAELPGKISILVPTRGRPENVKRLLASINATASSVPQVVFYVDEDDDSFPHIADDNALLVLGPRRTLSECWNECAKVATGDILMIGADDLVFKTKGWDTMVKRAFFDHPDKLILVHGDDGYWGSRFGTHPFLHRKWVETLGYVTPPYFVADYCDTWLNEVAEMLGRRMFLPFVHEHMHPLFGKAAVDKTHEERIARAKESKPAELYQQLADQRMEDVNRLRDAIQRYAEERKQELVTVG